MYMNKELKDLVEQASFDYANGCHGLCDRMKAIKEKEGRWPSMDDVCLLGQYVCRLIKERIE